MIKQPRRCNSNFKIKKIFQMKITNEPIKNIVNDLENHLIIKLNKKFNKKCINAKDKNGKIIQSGGNGNRSKQEDICYFYIMYEKLN